VTGTAEAGRGPVTTAAINSRRTGTVRAGTSLLTIHHAPFLPGAGVVT
jgi:hypothetical protein